MPLTEFTGGEHEVTVSSGRVFKLRELNAYQQGNADKCAAGDPYQSVYNRIAFSIVSVNGESVAPITNDLALEEFLKCIGGKELDDLALANAKRQAPPTPAELKNESAPDGLQPA